MNWLIVSGIQLIFVLIMYGVGIGVIGLSLLPGLFLCFKIWMSTSSWDLGFRIVCLSFGIITSYFILGICLIFVVGLIRIFFGLGLKEGEYPLHSLHVLKWAVTNSLMLVVWNVFGDFILLTPLVNIFYRLMGAKLGKNVQINSKFGADLSLLEIGDQSVIGGHATVIAHSVERGRLILRKVRIGKHVTIGLNSVILPGCEIGDGAIVAAGAVLNKNTNVEPKSVYVGVPAVSAKARHEKGPNE